MPQMRFSALPRSLFRRKRRNGDAKQRAQQPPEYYEARRKQREASTVTIWARSPSPPVKRRDDRPKRNSSREDRQSRRGDRHRHRDRSRDHSSSRRRRNHSASPSAVSKEQAEGKKGTSEKDVKEGATAYDVTPQVTAGPPGLEPELDIPIGPAPPDEIRLARRDYGKALLPGEAEGMAAYVQEGKRIPRRGEIGLSSDQIATYEEAGFIMSGSRHKRMNAVRMRKEDQIITAEEKRQLLKFAKDEKEKRNMQIVADFKEMINEKLKSDKPHDEPQ